MLSASAGDPSAPCRTRPRRPTGRERASIAVATVLTVALGVAATLVVPGLPGDLLGSALYTVLIALLLRFVGPRLPAVVVAGAATIASVGIEVLQLTGLPAAASTVFPPAAWVLGSTFVATDLLGYVLGGVAALVLVRVLHRAS
jgi:hypothetical protein